jgi:hypothetical protein
MRLQATALIAASLLAAAPALAIDQAENWELQLLGAGSSDNDFESGGFTLNATVGYFYNDQFQVALRQTASYTDTGSDNLWAASTRIGAYYHFNYETEQMWVPYVGVNLGYIYGDVNDTWIAGPEVGIRYFVNPTTFVGLSVAYDFLFDSADEGFDDGQFVYGVGIGFQW